MAIVGFVVLGDRTSHGGTVISACPNFTVNGIPIARIGDKVVCPRCKITAAIISSSHPSIFSNDISVAFDLDKKSCGAILYSSHNNKAGWGGNSESEESTPEREYVNNGENSFQEHFNLYDMRSGKPLSGVYYSIKTEEGRVFTGETDAEGRTDVVWTDSPKPVEITIGEEEKERDDKYHAQTGQYEGI